MTAMTFAELEPSAASLDRKIEDLVGKKVRGELTDGEEIELARLIARRTRNMRPVGLPSVSAVYSRFRSVGG